jgi:hypothetical protein
VRVLACLLCGAAGEPWLFWLLATVFGCAFLGSVVLLLWSLRRGDFREERARWLAVEAEEGDHAGRD